MQLRPYQSKATDAAKAFLRSSTDPCLIDAAPAAGKSFMIANLADWLHSVSGGKKVLCLAPSAELVTQNAEKFRLTGHPLSIFSASAGAKSTRHHVVFATPGTVSNSISRFLRDYAAVIIDECHGITPTIRKIIDAMRAANPNLRVIGLSGTPFRLGSGYIYRIAADGKTHGDDATRDPYFLKCVHRVSARQMLDEKFITPMVVGAINATGYDTSGLRLLPNGHFEDAAVERAFVGHGRETAAIVADVIHQASARKGGIMYFAATVAHAQEIMASLPPQSSAMVTGDLCTLHGATSTRKAVVASYRAMRVRHLVSVGALTTGFDVSHTETIALLRKTESAALLQQILGRAWRLHDGKVDSLCLDYASNVDDHFPDGDIYNPVIKAGKIAEATGGIEAECPACGHTNGFSRHRDAEGYELDANGYCVDVFGARVETDYGPMPGHYGRRCFGMVKVGPTHERCNYRWTSKDCESCGEANDIAARRCHACKGELVNPNDKLATEFKALKKDATQVQTDKVLSMEVREGVSQKGNRTVRADFKTPWRQFSVWFSPEANHPKAKTDWDKFQAAREQGQPDTISYVKSPESSFYRALAYGLPEDSMP
jgi:DNA repair protein RadD